MNEEWAIGLPAWILADANYPDFHVGRDANFALEFDARHLEIRQSKARECRQIGVAHYQITAEVIFGADDAWVIDFGLKAFRFGKPPKGVEAGAWITAEIFLEVDPFYYYENLGLQLGFPPLIYSWNVSRIEAEIAPDDAPLGLSARLHWPVWPRSGHSKVTYRTIPSTEPHVIPREELNGRTYDFILHARRNETAPTNRLSSGLQYNR